MFILHQTPVIATVYIVAESEADFTSIQPALNVAHPGDSILVREKETPYLEKLQFISGGNKEEGYITLMAFPGEMPVLDGTNTNGSNMILIQDKGHIRIIGFEICNNLNVNDGSGIRILGSGSYIELRNNQIHDIRGEHAMGITVYATKSEPISNLTIDHNAIYDCEPSQSEALVLNGNVTDFKVINNIVRDVNNIGIDFIGGESSINADPELVARNGICRGNQVYNANSDYGGGYAAGIYVDGGKNIIIENNYVSGCDLGIEIGAENASIITSGIIVRNNLIYLNEKVGLIFGGYADHTGRVKKCLFYNNTCYKNDTLNEGWGEFVIQYAEENIIKNNIFYSADHTVLIYSENGNINNTLNYNLWYTDSGSDGAQFVWSGTYYDNPADFFSGSGQCVNAKFANPLFKNADENDFHLIEDSPAIDMGDPTNIADSTEADIDNEPRVSGDRVDAGADEFVKLQGFFDYQHLPAKFILNHNYPNPFNLGTNIPFTLFSIESVQLCIYNSLGQLVKTLVNNEQLNMGYHTLFWNGKNNSDSIVASGVYIIQLRDKDNISQQKAILLK